jgi:GNAT superfamily N-acetyltransferase
VGGLTLRPARVDEAATLSELALRSKAHWGYDEEFLDACRAELTVTVASIDTGAVTVAVVGEVIAGFSARVDEPPVRELDALFVDPPFIGQGIGAALFAAFRAEAVADGCTRLRIGADPNALGFYERQGAVVVGERPSESVPGRRLPLLELDLTAD